MGRRFLFLTSMLIFTFAFQRPLFIFSLLFAVIHCLKLFNREAFTIELISKALKVKIYKTVTLPFVLYGRNVVFYYPTMNVIYLG